MTLEPKAPGNILQEMFLKSQLKTWNSASFCEIGGGNGYISNLFLEAGLTGKSFDLNQSACENNIIRNEKFVSTKKLEVINSNFFNYNFSEKFDIIFSCMVIEHLPEEAVNNYFTTCKTLLNPNGRIIVMVPSGMKFWGVEDEIAGHFKRYEKSDFEKIATNHRLTIKNITGLTYPLSNWLLSLSNRIVSKNEGHKKEMDMQEQTVLSGNRNNKFKTTFPPFFILILNELVMSPFYFLQKLNKNNPDSMIMYAEFSVVQ